MPETVEAAMALGLANWMEMQPQSAPASPEQERAQLMQWMQWLNIPPQQIPGGGGGAGPAPAIPVVSPGAISGTVGTAITTFQIQATNSPDSFAILPALPAGLTLNPTSGQITGSPSAAQSLTTYQMRATNAEGTSAPANLTIVVAAAGTAPIVTPATQNWQAGVAVNFQISATGSPTLYAITPALPLNLTLNTGTGQITGIPAAQQASTTYQMTAQNAFGTSAPANLTVTIAAALAAPVITPGQSLPAMTEGQAITPFTVARTGGAPASFSGTLPSGLSLSSPGGVISGTPAAGTAAGSPHSVNITATNASGSSTEAVTITINASVGWSVTHTFPAQLTFLAQPIVLDATNWLGWQPAFLADMSDAAMYGPPGPPNQAALPVQLYVIYRVSGVDQPPVQVPFDNWNTADLGPNTLREWGMRNDFTPAAITISGNNGTGSPLRLELRKA